MGSHSSFFVITSKNHAEGRTGSHYLHEYVFSIIKYFSYLFFGHVLHLLHPQYIQFLSLKKLLNVTEPVYVFKSFYNSFRVFDLNQAILRVSMGCRLILVFVFSFHFISRSTALFTSYFRATNCFSFRHIQSCNVYI